MESSIWLKSTPEQKVILVVLMLMANHSDSNWEWEGKPHICKAGEFITSVMSIEKKCGLGISRQNIRTAIQRFKKLEFLTIKVTNVNSLVTICNWETYQSEKIEANQPSNQQLTITQPTPNQPLTTNKNVKNEKNVIKKVEEKEYSPNSEELRLSELLFKEIRKNLPKFKNPDFQAWAKHINRMIRLDNRETKTIAKVIVWCQSDQFWQSNILSTDKLRKQFDRLELLSNGNRNDKTQRQQPPRDYDGQVSKYGQTI